MQAELNKLAYAASISASTIELQQAFALFL